MIKILVAIPCMDFVNTEFFQSMLSITKPDGIALKYCISRSSLIYDARNQLAQSAIDMGAERILWLDSDMLFPPDIIKQLSADLDEGRDFVTALCFTRKNPIKPVIYDSTGYTQDGNRLTPYANPYFNYPKNDIFTIAGSGFGAVMITTKLLEDVYETYGAPFAPQPGFGEDLSFCRRCEEMGVEMWCDSRVKVGHVGYTIVTEESYENGLKL